MRTEGRAPMTEDAFRCTQITLGKVFSNLTWNVPAGQTSVLIGPSGSGKSTLLRILSGLQQPEGGTVWRSHENIGMLFQRNALFDSMTASENLVFTLKENRWSRRDFFVASAKKKAKEMLELVGLAHAADLFPGELSGGMQKRLGIARALVAQPQILLYDDPTAGLDPITSRSIAQVILDIQRERKSTLVVVTNDIARAFQLADLIFVLSRKGLILAGDPKTAQQSTDPAVRMALYGEIP